MAESSIKRRSIWSVGKNILKVAIGGVILHVCYFLIMLMFPITPQLGPIGYAHPYLAYYWKNDRKSDSAVSVERELFLDVGNYKQFPYYYFLSNWDEPYEEPVWCEVTQIKKYLPDEKVPCVAVMEFAAHYCGINLMDHNCYSLKIPSHLWGDEAIRERIISAALRPCDYIFDPELGLGPEALAIESSKSFQGKRAFRLEARSLRWAGACDSHRAIGLPFHSVWFELPFFKPVNDTWTVYFAVVNEADGVHVKPEKFISVYKATRQGDVIQGEYVDDRAQD